MHFFSEPEELSGEKVVGSVIDSILDAAFPAASAAGDAINQILDNVNSHITLKGRLPLKIEESWSAYW